MRNDFKPAAFDPPSEDRETVAFRFFAARRLVRLTVLSAIQAVARNSLSSVKNGTGYCALGTPFSDRHVALRTRGSGPAVIFQNII